MLRRVIVMLLATLTVVGAFLAFASADTGERLVMQQAPQRLGASFQIPPEFTEPDLVLEAITNSAMQAGVNVVRTLVGFDENERSRTTHFIYQTTKETRIFDSFRIDSGRLLTATETQNSRVFLSSARTADPDQVGVIKDIGQNDNFELKSLATAFESLLPTGVYYLECSAESCQNFLQNLAAELSKVTGNIVQIEDLTAQTNVTGAQSGVSPWVTAGFWILVLVILALVIYRQMYETKHAGVMRLHGYNNIRVWYMISGRMILLWMGGFIAVTLIGMMLIPGVTSELVWQTFRQQFGALSITLLVSFITILYIRRIRVLEIIKNRKNTKSIFWFSAAIKIVLSTTLIIAISGIWANYLVINAERERMENWRQTSQFGIFAPRSVGNDLLDFETGNAGGTIQEVYDLYPVLNRQGALFVYAADYEPTPQQNSFNGYRSLRVNPNYLQEYPILSASGSNVTVQEEEEDWILLVPESFRNEEKDILNYFQEQRTGDGGVARPEKAILGREVPESFKTQQVRIIWIADSQDIFTFNPDVNPDTGSTVRDAIIEVMTEANSVGFDKINSITGGVSSGLKVRFIDGDAQQTLASLEPLLRDLRLDDNLRNLATVSDYALSVLQFIEETLRQVTIGLGVFFIILLIVIIQNMTILFEHYSRRIIVRRLFGLSFWRRYREFCVIFGISWLAQMIGIIILRLLGIEIFDFNSSTIGTIFAVSVLMLAAELILSIIFVTAFENRKTVTALKGEDA